MTTASRSFEAVYREHHDFVWRSLRGMGLSEASVDDATQEVFLVLHRRLGEFDPERGALRGWIYGVARMTARKYRRSHAQRMEREVPSEATEAASEAPRPSRGAAPEEAVARAEAAQLVQDFLESLDEDKREVFVLADIEGVTAPEIAEALGVNLNTVYSRLRLARKRFDAVLSRRAVVQEREVSGV